MKMRFAALWSLSAVAVFGQASWKELPGGRYELTDKGRTMLVYNAGVQQPPPGAPADRARCCYLHPVATPSGVVVTDDFPKDHYHHRGLFWGWPNVLVEGKRVDGWMMRGFAVKPVKVHAAKGRELKAENLWMAGDKELLREMVTIRYEKTGQFRVVVELEPLVTLSLQGSQEAGKGYGGMSARFAPRENTVIRTSEGEIKKDEDLSPHAWAELEATYAGKRARLRITPDKENPGEPSPWCLRFYGFVGHSWPARTAAELKPGQKTRMGFTIDVADVAP